VARVHDRRSMREGVYEVARAKMSAPQAARPSTGGCASSHAAETGISVTAARVG
jgi:hypothetical protein